MILHLHAPLRAKRLCKFTPPHDRSTFSQKIHSSQTNDVAKIWGEKTPSAKHYKQNALRKTSQTKHTLHTTDLHFLKRYTARRRMMLQKFGVKKRPPQNAPNKTLQTKRPKQNTSNKTPQTKRLRKTPSKQNTFRKTPSARPIYIFSKDTQFADE